MVQVTNMFKKIKSLFILDEGESTTETGNSADNNAQNVYKPENQKTEIGTSSSSVDGKPDQKFVDLLLKAIESNNIEGFDYLEYKNSLKSISNVIPDESMRFKSAFEMARTMGLTKQKLIDSANHYVDILNNENNKFKDALDNQKAKQIQGKADQLSSVEKAISEKQQLIEKLNNEIATAKSQLDTFKTEIDDAVVKLDLTNQQFVASYNLVRSQIIEDIDKMKTNL
ncbi:MAG: hypothetical protein IPL55_05080 [Saprospiraceae bacterium]|nr:hypothetical protein [Saprospiraceae bacterium]